MGCIISSELAQHGVVADQTTSIYDGRSIWFVQSDSFITFSCADHAARLVFEGQVVESPTFEFHCGTLPTDPNIQLDLVCQRLTGGDI